MVDQYDAEKKAYLRGLREKILLDLAQQADQKKILTFLARVGILNIDEQKKMVYFGVSNEFILTQVKKVFQKLLKSSVQKVYNPHFSISFVVYAPFSNGDHLLLADLKKLLNIKEEKKNTQHKLNKTIKQELSEYFWILFDPRFIFTTFVAGANNQFAYSAAKAVADAPGVAYNPLFLYGNVGLGKTHLMQAIGNQIMQDDPEKVVIYLPATKLVEEIVQALRMNKMSNLMKKFEEVDVLLIDDIQFLADKEKTQEVFHNLFNDFQSQKKQIVISSDRPPKELLHIEPRLKSRFSIGLVADIQAPDYETRIAILESKMLAKGITIGFNQLSLIAQYIKSNVRELEGALNILISRQQLSGQEITDDDVYGCLKTLGYYADAHEVNFDTILQQNKKSKKHFGTLVEMVAEYYGISIAELKSDSRKKQISTARQILMLLAKKYFSRTLEKIGDYFGGKNHATAIYAINNIEKKLKTDDQIRHDYQVFVDRIEQ